MSTHMELVELLREAGRTPSQNDVADSEGRAEPQVRDWIDSQRLDTAENPREVVARQAALNLLLKSTLYTQYREQTDRNLPELSAENVATQIDAARDHFDDPAFEESVLDDVATTFEQETVELLLSEREQLLAASNPAERVGELFEQVTPRGCHRTVHTRSVWRSDRRVITVLETFSQLE